MHLGSPNRALRYGGMVKWSVALLYCSERGREWQPSRHGDAEGESWEGPEGAPRVKLSPSRQDRTSRSPQDRVPEWPHFRGDVRESW